jgi:hypothetical protein
MVLAVILAAGLERRLTGRQRTGRQRFATIGGRGQISPWRSSAPSVAVGSRHADRAGSATSTEGAVMTGDIPRFDELPLIEKLGLRHSWDVFGRSDDVGTINHLTPERVAAAASLVRQGDVFDLTWPIDEPNPPMYGRQPMKHTIYSPARNELDDYLDHFYLQGSSQWDGLRHVRAREFGLYTGVTGEMTAGPGRLGVEHWARHGIVGRGVLVDVARHQQSLGTPLVQTVGRSIEVDEIAAAAEAQGMQLRSGDVLCIRLGWPAYYEKLSPERRRRLNERIDGPLSLGQPGRRGGLRQPVVRGVPRKPGDRLPASTPDSLPGNGYR